MLRSNYDTIALCHMYRIVSGSIQTAYSVNLWLTTSVAPVGFSTVTSMRLMIVTNKPVKP